jgi:hypothetical protein
MTAVFREKERKSGLAKNRQQAERKESNLLRLGGKTSELNRPT